MYGEESIYKLLYIVTLIGVYEMKWSFERPDSWKRCTDEHVFTILKRRYLLQLKPVLNLNLTSFSIRAAIIYDNSIKFGSEKTAIPNKNDNLNIDASKTNLKSKLVAQNNSKATIKENFGKQYIDWLWPWDHLKFFFGTNSVLKEEKLYFPSYVDQKLV